MNCAEVYGRLYARMAKGVMMHEELAEYYDFLGLRGYKRCHEYHYYEEGHNLRELNRYYINHHGKLIPRVEIDRPDVIPEEWRQHTREELSPNDVREGVRRGLEKWVRYERETKACYQEMYKELEQMEQSASAELLMHFLKDVDCELKQAERKWISLSAVEYSLPVIVMEQREIHDRYKKLIEK